MQVSIVHTTVLTFDECAGCCTGLEYLVRGPPGAEAVEAPYFTGVEHVEEPSECLCLLTEKTSDE